MSDTTPKETRPWLSDKQYNFLKFVAQILLPASGTLYAAIGGLWGLPHVNEVIGTIVATDTFLGVVLGISSAQYNSAVPKYDGTMQVGAIDENGLRTVQLDLDDHPNNLIDKDVVSFKVQSVEPLDEEVSATPGDLPQVPHLDQ